MMNAFLWAIVLLLVGLALMVLELFVPFAGTLGVLSALSIVASVLIVFYHEGLGPGTLYLLGVTVVVGLALVKGLHWWPYTAIGRQILNLAPDRDVDLEASLGPLDFLIGRFGLAKSKMLPSGVILVDGETYDAVSTGGPLEEGDPIQVVDVQGNRIVIRLHAVSLPRLDSDNREVSHDPVRDPGGSTSQIASAGSEPRDVPPAAELLYPDPFDESSSDERLP